MDRQKITTRATFAKSLFASLSLLFLLSGCLPSRYFRAQSLTVPAEVLDLAVGEALQEDIYEEVNWIPKDWWMLFEDDQLNHYICRALEKYPTIQAAKAQILASKYQADQVRATLFPTLNAAGDITREQLSKTGVLPSTSATGQELPILPIEGIPFSYTQYETELNFAYEFDFWGKNKQSLLAAVGEIKSKIAEEAFVRLSISVAVAQVYFQLQIDYAREHLLKRQVENRKRYLDYVQQKVKNHLENAITLTQARATVATTKRMLLEVQADIAVNEHQLKAYLAGNFDEEIDHKEIAQKSLPKVPLPKEIPMELLSHRPDIMSQLWLIHSAGHQIEVAKTAFYPNFNLLGMIGYQTIHFTQWFKPDSVFGSIGPAFTLPIFQGGRLVANLHEKEVDYNLAIFQYNELVLNAVKEVLDNIALLTNTYHQLNVYETEVHFQEELYFLIDQKLKNNMASALDLLSNERDLLAAKDLEAIALGKTYQRLLSLIKSLGGGY